MVRNLRLALMGRIVLIGMSLLLVSAPANGGIFGRALAQADAVPAPAPAPAPDPVVKPEAAPKDPAAAPQAELEIKVVALQGMVQVRLTPDQPWQAAKVDMPLHIGAEIRTGLRSICQFTIDGNHTVTLDRLGVVKVLDAIKADGKVKTDVGMKYGRTQYKVEVGAAEHEARVHAPSATLAVRGSFVTLEDNDAFGSTAIVDHSEKAIYKQRGPDGSVRVVSVELIKGRIDQTPEEQGNTPPTAGAVALRDTINDTGARLARASEAERDLVATYPLFNGGDNGGIISPNETRAFHDPTTTPSQPPSEPGTIQPGGLFFEAFWSGPENIFLFAIEPAFSGGVISTIENNPLGATTQLRTDGPAPASGFPTVPPSGNSSAIIYVNGAPGGVWTVGVGLVNPVTSLTTPVNIIVHRTAPINNIPALVLLNFDTVLGVTGVNETTTRVTTTLNVGGPPTAP